MCPINKYHIFLAEACKQKWLCIRDEYIRFRPKKTKKGYKKQVLRSKWHDNLYFLEEALQQREVEEEEKNQNQKKRTKTEDNSEQIQQKQQQQQTFKRQKYIHTLNEINFIKLLKELEEKRCELINDVINKKEDDLDLFCRHIGEVLRNLPSLHKAEAKKQISVILADYEIMVAKIAANNDSQQGTSSVPETAEMPESNIME